ncbi:two-component hybrid sensor and regulator [[Synechococcus] sp. NIES-970]|nr:two-component hybrid sensor and regulator [[Synechococcus] sp. NIES-970]
MTVPDPAQISPTQATILLVEDNLSNITTMVDYLQAKGYAVLVAMNGREGVAMARQQQPDLILMDIQMPEMDGLEAIARIRQDPAIATTPIIALTALAMKGDRERCLQAGADEYVSKPVRLKALLQLIQGFLRP